MKLRPNFVFEEDGCVWQASRVLKEARVNTPASWLVDVV